MNSDYGSGVEVYLWTNEQLVRQISRSSPHEIGVLNLLLVSSLSCPHENAPVPSFVGGLIKKALGPWPCLLYKLLTSEGLNPGSLRRVILKVSCVELSTLQ